MRSNQLKIKIKIKIKIKTKTNKQTNNGTHEIEDGPHAYIVIGVMVLSLRL